jgi:hypothetical protein
LEEKYKVVEESTVENPSVTEIDDKNIPEQETVQVSSTGQEALLPEPELEPEPEPVIEAKED